MPRPAFVILANAGIHSLQLVSMDSRLRGNDGQWQSPTVAYASGSDFRVIPWLIVFLLFRVSFSVFFRVIPWLILLLPFHPPKPEGNIMKAISFKQPLAQALITGTLSFAVRSWRTGHRGEILIHAARCPLQELRNLCSNDWARNHLKEWNIATVEDLPMSAFLGKTNLLDCIPLQEFDFAKEDYPFDIPDRGWVWIFSNPWKMLHPKMHPGKLGVFET